MFYVGLGTSRLLVALGQSSQGGWPRQLALPTRSLVRDCFHDQAHGRSGCTVALGRGAPRTGRSDRAISASTLHRRVAVLNERSLIGQGPIETVPAERPITILDLRRHTSGLTYGGFGTAAVHAFYPLNSNVAGRHPRSCGILGTTCGRTIAVSTLDRLGIRPIDRCPWPGRRGSLRRAHMLASTSLSWRSCLPSYSA